MLPAFLGCNQSTRWNRQHTLLPCRSPRHRRPRPTSSCPLSTLPVASGNSRIEHHAGSEQQTAACWHAHKPRRQGRVQIARTIMSMWRVSMVCVGALMMNNQGTTISREQYSCLRCNANGATLEAHTVDSSRAWCQHHHTLACAHAMSTIIITCWRVRTLCQPSSETRILARMENKAKYVINIFNCTIVNSVRLLGSRRLGVTKLPCDGSRAYLSTASKSEPVEHSLSPWHHATPGTAPL